MIAVSARRSFSSSRSRDAVSGAWSSRCFVGVSSIIAAATRYDTTDGSSGSSVPDDPSVVSYLVAAAMMLDTPTKQRLLQAPDTASRLRDELKLLRAETAIIRNLPSLPASELTRSPTSLN